MNPAVAVRAVDVVTGYKATLRDFAKYVSSLFFSSLLFLFLFSLLLNSILLLSMFFSRTHFIFADRSWRMDVIPLSQPSIWKTGQVYTCSSSLLFSSLLLSSLFSLSSPLFLLSVANYVIEEKTSTSILKAFINK